MNWFEYLTAFLFWLFLGVLDILTTVFLVVVFLRILGVLK